jgi:hypothetical protein
LFPDTKSTDVTGRALSEAPVVPRLPDCRDSEYGDDLPVKLTGAEILSFGTTDMHLEGGGLIIDYQPKGESIPMRIVFSFNELGMWISYDGPMSLQPIQDESQE